MKNAKKPKTQESHPPAKNSIEAFFERLGTPIENITEEMAGTTTIIGVTKPPQPSEGSK